MAVMVEGIKNAGSNVTGETIKASLEKIKDFDTGGVTSKITFTPQSHKGARAQGVPGQGRQVAADHGFHQGTVTQSRKAQVAGTCAVARAGNL
jgi:hypothetical protein